LIGQFADPDDGAGAGQVLVGIETDRGPWVAALVAAGYRVFAINRMQVARYRERHSTSGAKSDAGDAHALADMVRTDAHQLRPVAGDSSLAEGIKGGPGTSEHDPGIGPELREDPLQVPGDDAGRQVELLRDLLVGQAGGGT
jgi:hypothetical protein